MSKEGENGYKQPNAELLKMFSDGALPDNPAAKSVQQELNITGKAERPSFPQRGRSFGSHW